jgi:hypothetical protein
MLAPLIPFATLALPDAAPNQTRRVSVVAHSMPAGDRDSFDNVQFLADGIVRGSGMAPH